jgi:glycopeptide antibiotics resistance protein
MLCKKTYNSNLIYLKGGYMKKTISKVLQSDKKVKGIFVIYLILLFFLVVLKFDGSFDRIIDMHQTIKYSKAHGLSNINFTFMKTISPYLENIAEPYALYNIVGNIVPFAPLGFFISIVFFRKSFLRTIILCLIIIVFIELVQLVLMIGAFDIDDIFLNFIGCMSGYIISLAFLIYKNSQL